MQNTLLGAAFFVIAVVLAAIVVPLSVDWSRHRDAIEAEASRLFGTRVVLSGNIAFSLVPVARVRVEQVSFGEGGENRIGAVEAELALAPLLRGRVELVRLVMDRPELVLGTTPAMLPVMAIEDLAVRDGRLIVPGAQGAPVRFDAITVSGVLRDSLRLEGRARVAGRVVSVAGSLSLHPARTAVGGGSDVRMTVRDAAIGLATEIDGQIHWEERPRFEGALAVSGTVPFPWRGTGPATLTADGVVTPRMEIEFGPPDARGRAVGPVRLGFGSEPVVEAVFSSHQIDLDRLAGRTPQAPLDHLRTIADRMPALAVPALAGSVSLDVGIVTLGQAVVRDVKADLVAREGGWRIASLDARLPGDSAIRLSGDLGLAGPARLSGRIDLDAPRPVQFLAWLEGRGGAPGGPVLSQDPVRIRGVIAAQDGSLSFDEAVIDSAGGSMRGRLAVERPLVGRHSFVVDLSGDALDLPILLGLSSRLGVATTPEPDTDVTFGLRAAHVTWGDVSARDVEVSLASDGRRLRVDRLLIADVKGVAVQLSGEIDVAGVAHGLHLDGRVNASERADWPFLISVAGIPQPSPEVLRSVPALAAEVSLRGDARTFTMTARGDPAFWPFHLDLERLTQGPVRLALAGTLPEASALTGTPEKVGPLHVDVLAQATPDRLSSADIRLDLGDTTLRARVAASGTGFDGEASVVGGDARGLASLLGWPMALLDPLTVDLAGRFAVTGLQWRALGWRGVIGDSRLQAALSGEGLGVHGEVHVDRADFGMLASLLLGPGALADPDRGDWSAVALGVPFAMPVTGDVALEISAMATPFGVAGLSGRLERRRDWTRVRELAVRGGDVHGTGQVQIDHGGRTTSVSGDLALSGIDAGFLGAGASGRATGRLQWQTTGASVADLMANLTGEGELAWQGLTLSGVAPGAVARVTRDVERAFDAGRRFTPDTIGAVLGAALAPPTVWPDGQARLGLIGPVLTASPVVLSRPDGTLSVEGRVSLRDGEPTLLLRVAGQGMSDQSDPPPPVTVTKTAVSQQLDVEDLAGWLVLRIIERDVLRRELADGDRQERRRQRAFSRLPLPHAETRGPEVDVTPLPLRRPASSPATEPPAGVGRRMDDAVPLLRGEPLSILPRPGAAPLSISPQAR